MANLSFTFARAAYWFKERMPEADQAVITACRDRHYADGTAVQEMAKAFNDYYNE